MERLPVRGEGLQVSAQHSGVARVNPVQDGQQCRHTPEILAQLRSIGDPLPKSDRAVDIAASLAQASLEGGQPSVTAGIRLAHVDERVQAGRGVIDNHLFSLHPG